MGTSRRLGSTPVKVIDATINVVASDQMLRSIGFIVTMNALGRGVSGDSSRGKNSNLMDSD